MRAVPECYCKINQSILLSMKVNNRYVAVQGSAGQCNAMQCIANQAFTR